MITGQVNSRNEAIIPIHLLNLTRQTRDTEAVLDTGFSGFLMLPMDIIAELQLPYMESRYFTLGDQRSVSFDLYAVSILWDGTMRRVLALAKSGGSPLVGMALLKGYTLFLDAVDGGEVRIELRR